MPPFYKTSTVWVVDFLYDGRARRWFKAFDAADDAAQITRNSLQEAYGARAKLVSVREATAEEDLQYLRGDVPGNAYCPTGR